MPSRSIVRYNIFLLGIAALSFLLSPSRAAANPAPLNLNISNHACGCTNLLGFPDGTFVVSNSSESVSVAFSVGRLQFFFCDALGNCRYNFASGGSIELVINAGTGRPVTFLGEFVSADETIESCGGTPAHPVTPDIGMDGSFKLDGFSGVGSISAFDSCGSWADSDQAGITFSGTPTPEPSSLLLLGTGLFGLGFAVRRFALS